MGEGRRSFNDREELRENDGNTGEIFCECCRVASSLSVCVQDQLSQFPSLPLLITSSMCCFSLNLDRFFFSIFVSDSSRSMLLYSVYVRMMTPGVEVMVVVVVVVVGFAVCCDADYDIFSSHQSF